ncbi:BglG family transcription antiterminator, partial [Streptococcus agalactiae]
QKAACRLLLDEVTDYSYVMKSSERLQLSLVSIVVAKDRVTIDRLMQLNDVSRNTILNDLNELRSELAEKEYNLQLQSTKCRGYFLDGHPLSIIQYLYKLLDDIYHNGSSSFIDLFNHKLSQAFGASTYFSKEVLDYFHHYLFISQRSLGKKINSQDGQFMIQILPFILMAYRKMRLSPEVQTSLNSDFSLVWQRKEYEIAKELADELEENFQLSLDEIEVGLVAMLMLSFRKDRDNHLESQDYDDMRATLTSFLKELEERYHLHFVHKKDLLRQLLTHCKALLYRKRYGIFSVNPLTEHIKDKYEELFAITSSSVKLLEKAWQIKLTDDDVAYLTIHLGGELRNSQQSPNKLKLVIVSDEGIAIQKLLLKQCQRYLTNSDIEAVFTTEQYQSVSDLMHVDMVVSTSDALESRFPMLVVHPVLTDDDIIRLIRFSKKGNCANSNQFTNELEKTIAQYVKEDSERYVLKSKIEKLIHQELLQDVLPLQSTVC